MKRSFPSILGLLTFTTSHLFGVQTSSKVFEGYPELSDGELEGVAVHWDGGLGLGPALGSGLRPEEGALIWDMAADPDAGLLYFSTGGPGAVYRLEISSGEISLILDPDEPLLRAIHVASDGYLYAGSSPEGRIYRVAPGNGFPEIVIDLESLYVWQIEADPNEEGALLIGAGAPGRIYRLPADFSPSDDPEIVVDAEAIHVSAFAYGPDDSLFFATGPGGHLMKQSADGTVQTLVELGAAEVRKIFPAEDGSVRIAVFRSESGDGGNGNQSDSKPPLGLPSGIFEVGPDGFVELLLAGSTEKIFSATMLGDEMLIGSDTRGRVYRFHNRFDWSLLAESENGGEVSAIERIDDKTAWVATSNPAAIHRLSYDPTATGLFTADVFNAGQKVRWGALTAAGVDLDAVRFETRTGNRRQPDESWSEWVALDENKISSPPGRFFQFRASFENPGAVVRRIEAFYQLPNEAPAFRRVTGLPVRLESIPMPPQPPGRATLPQLFNDNGNSGEKNGNGSIPQPFVVHEETGWLSIVWEAIDPNDDELRYRVFLRKLDAPNWFLLAEDLDQPFFSLNVAGFEPGYYEPRIEASDRMSNPPGMAKTSETRGNLILIDNQPPEIIPPTKENPLEFTVRDAFSVIRAVSFRLEGSESRALLPLDGIFDSQTESFRLPEDAAQPGATLHIEAIDVLNNRAAWTGLIEGEKP
ncbi:MAG: hypothetical protein AAGJ81_09885 [Verrucomicrobiota bacterium]